jgi:hypothetical protein
MRKPSLVPAAIYAPGTCMVCGNNYGAMVDTGVDIPGDGRMYLCTRMCVPLILELVEHVRVQRMCIATTAAGEPCQGVALEGKDYCVAHHALNKVKEEEHGLASPV